MTTDHELAYCCYEVENILFDSIGFRLSLIDLPFVEIYVSFSFIM